MKKDVYIEFTKEITMVLVSSQSLALGSHLPTIQLKEVRTGRLVKPKPQNYKCVLICFVCAHCPYVLHIIQKLSELSFSWIQKGVCVVGVSSNDGEEYPEDSLEGLKNFATERKLFFPLCYDETQQVARSFRAACTPEFFLYDKRGKLVYHGQFDSSRPNNALPVTGMDLKKAIQNLLDNRVPNKQQTPSSGCSIKWKTQDHSSSK
jgi:peroxiredoxin